MIRKSRQALRYSSLDESPALVADRFLHISPKHVSIKRSSELERCLHQGRQCRNGVGDFASRPPGFTSSEPCYGSWIEASRISAPPGPRGVRDRAEDRRRE